MKKTFIAILFICLFAAPASIDGHTGVLNKQSNSFSIEQILSSAFPSELVAAPAGGKVAWVLNARGVRNVWVAEAPGYKGRSVTSYQEDDGQDIGELVWTPDGRSVVYVRGGDLEGFGENPNPRSNPEGVGQAVWIVTLDGTPPRKLGDGHSPAVSPKGDQVAFIYQNAVWSLNTEGSEKATQLLHIRGNASSLRWSPDGLKLAFVSGRRDHSLIGVYDWAKKTVRFLAPSVDRDAEPVWSKDSRRVAFIRIPTSSRAFDFGPERTGSPWSIYVADVETGSGSAVWRADEGPGSVFREVVADNQLLWGADDRIVFPWEKNGWTHLYSISASAPTGARATLLTPGEFEVEHVSLTTDGREVLYSSNQGDIDRRHIWRVGVTGGQPSAVTGGKGIEWSPVQTGDGRSIALLHSDARRPARAAIINGSEPARDLAPEAIPSDFPEAALVEPQQVIFSAADGMRIHGQLFLPANLEPNRRYPAAIFFHGGSRRQMLLGWHYMGYYHNAYGLNQYLANHGYVVLSVNYRSGIGYGMEFREALNYGATGASEFNDVLGAGLYLRNRPEVDASRIGLWGGSYGGYLTALGLARASRLFAAGVDFHGVHDWNVVIRNFVPAYDPRANPEAARVAFASSPMASIKTWRSPVLLIHGDDDRNVPFSETVHLVEALREQKVEFEQLIFPDEIHDFLTHLRWLEAYHATSSFLDRHLKR